MKLILLFFVIVFMIFSTPVKATHCNDITSSLNAVVAKAAGTTVVAIYIDLDALMYLGFLNNLFLNDPFLIGEEVIVMSNEKYPNVVALVFHDGCFAGSGGILRLIHFNWNEMIVGVEASDDDST